MKKTVFSIISAAICMTAGAQAFSDSLEFVRAYSTSPAEMLKGQVAGVRVSSYDGSVNGALNVSIRGVNALRSDSQPLYIVDGTILSTVQSRNLNAFWQDTYKGESYTVALNNLSYINSYDIESIEVLKDVAATAIYGAKGANGVVIINTRKAGTEKASVKWNSNAGFSPDLRGISHNHHMSVSGLNKQTNYYIGASFRQVAGPESNVGSTYGSLNAGFETKANKVVWFGMNNILSIGRISSISTTNWYGAPSYTLASRGILLGDNLEGWKSDYDDKATDNRNTTNVYLTLNFTPWLRLKTVIGLDFQGSNRFFWYGDGTPLGASRNGAASVISTMSLSYNANSELLFHRYLSEAHRVDFAVGGELTGDLTKFNTMNGNEFFDHSLRGKGMSLAQSKANLHNFSHLYSHLAAYARASWSYKELFGIQGLFRPDYTPRYDGSNPQLYYSASAFLDVKKVLLNSLDSVSGFKLSCGYGAAGREIYVPYDLFGNYTSGKYPSLETGSEIYHDGLNRVRTSEFSLRADIGVLEDRITASVGYYDRISEDALSLYCFGKKTGNYWDWSGRNCLSTISSSLTNRGIEAELAADVIRKDNLRWRVSLNGAYNVNQLSSVDEADTFGHEVGCGLVANVNAVGLQAGQIVGYETNPDGSFLDQTRDGKITEADKVTLGKVIPEFTGALNSDFTAGRFSAGLTIDGAAGFCLVNLNNFVKNGADVPIITDSCVEKADFLRLSRLSAAYRIPLKAKWLRSLTVSASAMNLFTLTSYSGWNPDVNSFSSNGLSRGLDYASAAAARSFMIGVSINF